MIVDTELCESIMYQNQCHGTVPRVGGVFNHLKCYSPSLLLLSSGIMKPVLVLVSQAHDPYNFAFSSALVLHYSATKCSITHCVLHDNSERFVPKVSASLESASDSLSSFTLCTWCKSPNLLPPLKFHSFLSTQQPYSVGSP